VCGTLQLQSFESSQRGCNGAKHRWEPSAASPLCTRAVAASEPDVLLTRLVIEGAGDYDLIGRPGLARLQAPRHGHVECVFRVHLHGARPQRRAAGFTRLGPDGVFLYFDLALSSQCGFFRASVRLAHSLLEHPKLTRWSVNELVVLYTLQAGAPSCYGLRRTASWCDMMGLYGSTPVADKLSSLTSFAYDKKAVWCAMHYLREHTDRSKGDQCSGFAKRGITWVMPSTWCCIC